MWERVRQQVRAWWEGEKVPYDNEPGSPAIFFGWDHRLHWTARAARATWSYFKLHHQWVIGTVIFGLIGFYVAIKFGR